MQERINIVATYIKTKNRIQAQVRLQGIKIFKTFPDKKSARVWALQKEQEIIRGKRFEVNKNLTLKDLFERYKKEFTVFKITKRKEILQIDRLIKNYQWLVETPIYHLSASDFIKFKSLRVKDSGNNASKNNYRATNRDLTLLGALYKKAIEVWNLGIEVNPLKLVEKFPNSLGRYRPIKFKEYRALLKYADSDFKRTLIVYRHTGMRPSEIHGLSINDLDIENQKLVIRKAKGNKTRLVDCSKYLLNYLYGNKKNKLIPLSQNAFRLRFTRAINKLNIADLMPYDFRRARIQKLIDANKPIGYVAQQVGHSSFSMLARYYGISLR